MVLLLDAPASLASQLPLKRALDAYAYMEEQLVGMDVCTRTDGQPLDSFADLIDRIYCVNHDAMRLIAQAVQHQPLKLDHSAFLTEFFSHRVRLRTLCGQASALWNSSNVSRRARANDDGSSDYSPKDMRAAKRCDSDTGQIGALQRHTNVAGCLSDAAAAASDVCLRTFGTAPEVDVAGDMAASLLYMPDHLFGVFFELLKNSMRAVCEKHGDAAHKLPHICIRVYDGVEDITVAVEDKGAGFSAASLPDLFRFYYSTSLSRVNVGDDAVSMYHSGSRSNAMAGHGYGLPLARINVRSFGGEIILAPMQGAGCAAYVYLHKNSDATF
jgi:signal transduction histidine kinase